jgi:hypothetical protein
MPTACAKLGWQLSINFPASGQRLGSNPAPAWRKLDEYQEGRYGQGRRAMDFGGGKYNSPGPQLGM